MSRLQWVWFTVRQFILGVATAGLLWSRYAIMATGAPKFQRMDNPASFADSWITRVRREKLIMTVYKCLCVCPVQPWLLGVNSFFWLLGLWPG